MIDICKIANAASIDNDSIIIKCRTIKLETNQLSIIGQPYKVSLNSKYIVLNDRYKFGLRVFDKNGNFVTNIGKKGKGPQELFEITDFFIGNNDTLFILDNGKRRISYYSIRNSKLINHIEIHSLPTRIAVNSRNEIFCLHPGHRSLYSNNYLVSEIDFDGKIKNQYFQIPKNKYKLTDELRFFSIQKVEDSLFFWDSYIDSVFVLNSKKHFYPIINIDNSDNKMSLHKYRGHSFSEEVTEYCIISHVFFSNNSIYLYGINKKPFLGRYNFQNERYTTFDYIHKGFWGIVSKDSCIMPIKAPMLNNRETMISFHEIIELEEHNRVFSGCKILDSIECISSISDNHIIQLIEIQ